MSTWEQHPGRVGTPAILEGETVVAEIPVNPTQVLRVQSIHNRDGSHSVGFRVCVRDDAGQLWPMKGLGFWVRSHHLPAMIDALLKAQKHLRKDRTT